MINIIWADDEIDLLKPHLIYLEEKGYNVIPAKSGDEALDLIHEKSVQLIFLDENMPGLSGLETLTIIKQRFPHIPVVMITKSEEESIMEEAIGSKISDYLIKPVNPLQILLAIKKNLDLSRLVEEKTTMKYQQDFRKITEMLSFISSIDDWYDIYKKLTYWQLEIENTGENGIEQILDMQKSDANAQFFKFVKKNYKDWLYDKNSPLMSHKIIKDEVIPIISNAQPTYFILIDNLRYDQWKVIEAQILEDFDILYQKMYTSILPTATQYARNSIFSGLLPSMMEKRFPNYWKNDEDEGGKNMFEKEFLIDNLARNGVNTEKISYTKITNIDYGRKFITKVNNLINNKLNVIVYNFVDMLSHARTDMKVIKELADDDAAYRSLTNSWFNHSPLREILKEISKSKANVIITTDHGTINVNKPSKVIGDRNVNVNLRYKQGKNLNYQKNDVFEIVKPSEYYLPAQNLSSKYIFAKEDMYFVYQNNYNQFVNFYKNSYQHGGISMEEMLIPIISLKSK
ncbi:MAG: two-component system response regulator [Flavobacteriales bacterium]|nr:two-component system response regulator [Flavobacteriales bacterium]